MTQALTQPAEATGPSEHPAPAKDSLGCLSSHLQRDQTLRTEGVSFHRKTMERPQLHHVETEASARGLLLGISMCEGHSRRILDGRRASRHDFGKGSIYIRSFGERYCADIRHPFDFMLLEISQANLERSLEERTGMRVRGLSHATAVRDDVLFHLAHALAPALSDPASASALFVDQMSVTMVGYLVATYGGAAAVFPRVSRALSHLHEARAKEMLRGRMDGGITVTEIAQACGLSRSYFIHAFRQTTGYTPHQWLIAQRLEQARALLMNPRLPLANVAVACGFADQSHFTRMFAQHVGMPPGHWRRRMRVGT